ncbi:glycosyltransferase [uncultured Microbacterium sp.]|uniref:Glycosyltransferase n=1 Tax=uncultured Microbacterium sp. TaxID=191216 RepID=A0A1Y5NXU4_9MICO|nr:glycosyltransferase [uncultured Microbacterium sp.]SBS71203.1 Glycosyltransferase [uncultured Microbacterium sp.]
MPTVLFVHPGTELFGSDRMLLESVIASVGSGYRTVVAVPSGGPLIAELRDAGAEVVIVPMLVLRKALLRPRGWPELARLSLRGWAAAWRLLRRLRPDIIYVNTVTIPQWPVAGNMMSIPVVSHVHEAEASGSRAVNAGLYMPHTWATSVLVNSDFSRNTVARSLPRLGARAQVVYNGVASPPHPTNPRATIDGPLRVLYVGRLSPRKGPDLLIEAARLLDERGIDTRIDLVGSAFDGYQWYEHQLADRITAAGFTGRVVLHGFHADIWPFLEAADVLVVPSRVDEPFGNTAVEGVLALRPIIASDTSGLREAAGGHSTAFLAQPDSARAIADALQRIIDEWSTVRDEVHASARSAAERHSPTAYREQIADVLRAAGRPSGRRSETPTRDT